MCQTSNNRDTTPEKIGDMIINIIGSATFDKRNPPSLPLLSKCFPITFSFQTMKSNNSASSMLDNGLRSKKAGKAKVSLPLMWHEEEPLRLQLRSGSWGTKVCEALNSIVDLFDGPIFVTGHSQVTDLSIAALNDIVFRFHTNIMCSSWLNLFSSLLVLWKNKEWRQPLSVEVSAALILRFFGVHDSFPCLYTLVHFLQSTPQCFLFNNCQFLCTSSQREIKRCSYAGFSTTLAVEFKSRV